MTSELAGLGRRPQFDARNKNFALPKKIVPTIVRRKFWWGAGTLDQLDTPECVGFAGYGWLLGGPTTNEPDFTPHDLYRWAQDRDQWPGSDYEGTSTLGLMKALKDKGFINEYRWAFDAETLMAWVLTSGPVLVGTNWHHDMFMPDIHNGFIFPVGEIVGGHEWRIVGADRDKVCPDGSQGAVRMVNSWGSGWGEHGRAWVSLDDLDQLIKDGGEAVTALEVKL